MVFSPQGDARSGLQVDRQTDRQGAKGRRGGEGDLGREEGTRAHIRPPSRDIPCLLSQENTSSVSWRWWGWRVGVGGQGWGNRWEDGFFLKNSFL